MGGAKFYIRRFEVWGGGWHYAVAECDTRKLASGLFKSRRTADTLMARMEADWLRFLERDAPLRACDKRRKTPGKPRVCDTQALDI